LLLEAVPTLVRRLFRNWRLAVPSGDLTHDLQVDYHPLPDFVPRNLFSDLALPEVSIIVPPATVNHEERIERMPILQALGQFAPGRVTRRFAHERGALSHWVPVDSALPEQDARISDYAVEHEFVGTFTGRLNTALDDGPLLVFRPWTIQLERTARSQALPSSNARLLWQSDIEANGDAVGVPVPMRSRWHGHVASVDFHLHRFGASVSVRRFARTVHANVRTLQDDFSVILHFTSDDSRPAAVGFELEVDGFRVDVALPSTDALVEAVLPPEQRSAARMAYLRDAFRRDPELPEDLNAFQRNWLFEFLVTALLAGASTDYPDLRSAIDVLLSDDQIDAIFGVVMDALFGAVPPSLPDDNETEDADADEDPAAQPPVGSSRAPRSPGRLQKALLLHLGRGVVRDRLRSLAEQFIAPDAQAYQAWLRRLTLDTLGEAMLQACIASAPRQATVDTLLVDIRDEPGADIASIWISETTLGGAGVLEAFAERFAAEPGLFFTALEAALAPTDLELVDESLREILLLSTTEPQVADDMARLRATQSHTERASIWQSFSRRLTQRGGIDLSHALSVSLNNRLLRAGSGPDLDRLLLQFQTHWTALEQRFGLSLGVREFAYVASRDAAIANAVRRFLSATLPAAACGHVTVLSAITSLLWPRAHEVRQSTLQSYNPFRDLRSTDPAIVRHLLLARSIPTIDLGDADWEAQLNRAFTDQGTGRLSTGAGEAARLRALLVRLVATPVGVGVLQFFPAIDRFERADGRLYATLTLREQV
jgi:hypothetical protein